MNDDGIDQLTERIKQTKLKIFSAKSVKTKESNIGIIGGVVIDLLAGLSVGAIIGLFFDDLFGTKSVFLLLCILLSVFAAFRVIWKKYIR